MWPMNLSTEVRKHMSDLGKRGGAALARKRTQSERTKAARKAALARWQRYGAKKGGK